MSDRDPRAHRDWRDPGPPPDWRDWRDDGVASGASVFGPPARPRDPEPGAYGGRPGPGRAWDERAAYPPPPPDTPPYPGEPWPPGPPAAPRRRPDGGRPGRRADGRRAGHRVRGDGPGPGDDPRGPDAPSRRPGGGLPVGAGALVGVAGLACFVVALAVLPWFEAGGRGVTLADIRTAFTVPATQPEDLPLLPDQGGTTGTTAPGGIPTPGQVSDAVEERVRDEAAEAAAAAVDSGKSRYLELYAGTLWMVAAGAVAAAVVFSTILAPSSLALSLLLGFRRLAGLVTVLAGAAHGAALWVVFTGSGAPEPATGVWLGVGGLAAVLLGCVIGPKR